MKDLEDILKRTIEHLRSVSDSDAVVGKTIVTEDGTAVIPVSKVSYGFVAGGGEYGGEREGERVSLCGGERRRHNRNAARISRVRQGEKISARVGGGKGRQAERSAAYGGQSPQKG